MCTLLLCYLTSIIFIKMGYRDLLRDEIEKIGKVLASVFYKLTKNKTKEEANVTEEILANELEIDLQELLELDNKSLSEYLTNRSFNSNDIEKLGDVLNEIGEIKNQKDYFKLSYDLYILANQISKTFSFDRNNKIESLKHII